MATNIDREALLNALKQADPTWKPCPACGELDWLDTSYYTDCTHQARDYRKATP